MQMYLVNYIIEYYNCYGNVYQSCIACVVYYTIYNIEIV